MLIMWIAEALTLTMLATPAPSAHSAQTEAAPPADSTPPNIVLIIADDLGYGELGCYRAAGREGIATPHLDALAASGVRFTDGYVSCPVCAPTRAGILTGRYQQRIGFELNPGSARDASMFGLPRSSPTLAERLSMAGYDTAMVGKWHLGDREGMRPTERGFGEFFGFLGGSHAYLDAKKGAITLTRGTAPIEEREYLTDAFAREACSFITRAHERPYFLYLSFNAVHAPMETDSARLMAATKEVQGAKRRQTFAAMLRGLDDAVGRVLAAVNASSAAANTLVFFISDNGGPTRSTSSRNDPLRGVKAQLWEGGIRVPFMMRWSRGGVPAGMTCAQPVISLDITATALRAAGVVSSEMEGVDLVALARDGCAAPAHEGLFWRYGDQWAVRMGDWKLVVARADRTADAEAPSVQGRSPQLYNLRDDIAESKDLSGEMPERVAKMRAAFDAWNAANIPAKWGGAAAK